MNVNCMERKKEKLDFDLVVNRVMGLGSAR